MDYDETIELRRYIRMHLQKLAHADEWNAYRELEKQAGSAWDTFRALEGQAGSEQQWDIGEADLGKESLSEIEADATDLIDRLEMHRQKLENVIFDRVSKSNDAPLVHRCRACQRVLRSSKAQQCFWCGADWH